MGGIAANSVTKQNTIRPSSATLQDVDHDVVGRPGSAVDAGEQAVKSAKSS